MPQHSESVNSSCQALFSLMGALTVSPNPDDSGEPCGTWGPVVRQALDRVHRLRPQPEPKQAAMLNPPPIPPRWVLAGALAEVMIDRVEQLEMMAFALPPEVGASVRAYTSDLIRRFVDDYCGNGIRFHVPRHGSFPSGDDEPQPIGPLEFLVVGLKFIVAAEGSRELSAAGEKLIEACLQQMG